MCRYSLTQNCSSDKINQNRLANVLDSAADCLLVSGQDASCSKRVRKYKYLTKHNANYPKLHSNFRDLVAKEASII
jgi:hypothetical protein